MGSIAIEKFRHLVFPGGEGALRFDFAIASCPSWLAKYRLRVAVPRIGLGYPPRAPATPFDEVPVPGLSVLNAANRARLDFLGTSRVSRGMRLTLLKGPPDARPVVLAGIDFTVPVGYLSVIASHSSYAGSWSGSTPAPLDALGRSPDSSEVPFGT